MAKAIVTITGRAWNPTSKQFEFDLLVGYDTGVGQARAETSHVSFGNIPQNLTAAMITSKLKTEAAKIVLEAFGDVLATTDIEVL